MRLLSILLLAGLISSCAYVRAPATGFLYTETLAPQSISSNQAGNRVGEACVQSYLGMVATGDASIETARRNGGITMITSIDEQSKSILGLWAKYCIVVRGR